MVILNDFSISNEKIYLENHPTINNPIESWSLMLVVKFSKVSSPPSEIFEINLEFTIYIHQEKIGEKLLEIYK